MCRASEAVWWRDGSRESPCNSPAALDGEARPPTAGIVTPDDFGHQREWQLIDPSVPARPSGKPRSFENHWLSQLYRRASSTLLSERLFTVPCPTWLCSAPNYALSSLIQAGVAGVEAVVLRVADDVQGSAVRKMATPG